MSDEPIDNLPPSDGWEELMDGVYAEMLDDVDDELVATYFHRFAGAHPKDIADPDYDGEDFLLYAHPVNDVLRQSDLFHENPTYRTGALTMAILAAARYAPREG